VRGLLTEPWSERAECCRDIRSTCVRSSRDRIRFQSSTWLVIVRGAWNGARADAWTGERKRRRRGAPSRLPCPPRRARAAAVWRVAACGLMGTGRTLNGTREVSAVFDFRFRARYEPQLVLKSVYATLKPLHGRTLYAPGWRRAVTADGGAGVRSNRTGDQGCGGRSGSPATNFLPHCPQNCRFYRFFSFLGAVHSGRSSALGAPHTCSPISATRTAAASCLLADQSVTRLCCCFAFCGLLWQRQRAHVFQLQSHVICCFAFVFCVAAAPHVCCMLRSSMLLTAAQRRLMATPISYLEGRKAHFCLTFCCFLIYTHIRMHREKSCFRLTELARHPTS
jgi:hypothetical protein